MEDIDPIQFDVDISEGQFKVTVYGAQERPDKKQLKYKRDNAYQEVCTNVTPLIEKLTPSMLFDEPEKTLTSIGEHLRIDSQPASNEWRNIHIQNGINKRQKSYSVVTIGQGAKLCFSVGYENELLDYLRKGLSQSFTKETISEIRVKIEQKMDIHEQRKKDRKKGRKKGGKKGGKKQKKQIGWPGIVQWNASKIELVIKELKEQRKVNTHNRKDFIINIVAYIYDSLFGKYWPISAILRHLRQHIHE